MTLQPNSPLNQVPPTHLGKQSNTLTDEDGNQRTHITRDLTTNEEEHNATNIEIGQTLVNSLFNQEQKRMDTEKNENRRYHDSLPDCYPQYNPGVLKSRPLHQFNMASGGINSCTDSPPGLQKYNAVDQSGTINILQ